MTDRDEDPLASHAQLFGLDRIGRKPVIVSGLAGVALASLCFGMSSTFWQVLLFRALAGGLTGNVA